MDDLREIDSPDSDILNMYASRDYDSLLNHRLMSNGVNGDYDDEDDDESVHNDYLPLVPVNVNNNASPVSDPSDDDEEDDIVVNRIKENIKEKVREELHDEILAIQSKTANLGAQYDGAKKENHTLDGEDLSQLDPKLRKAILKMRRLDKMLASVEKREMVVKRDRILLHRSICVELTQALGRKESQDEVANREKYLSLELPPSHNEGVTFEETPAVTPLFDTQPQEQDLFKATTSSATGPHPPGQSGPHSGVSPLKPRSHSGPIPPKRSTGQPSPSSSTGNKSSRRAPSVDSLLSDSCSELGEGSSCGGKGARRKVAQDKDFITRNIELAADADSTIAMTDDEKCRLKQLLADIEEEPPEQPIEDDNPYAVCIAEPGEGYMPEPRERQDLERIESRLKEILPSQEYEMLCGSSASLEAPVPLFTRGLLPTGATSSTDELGEPTLQVVHDDRTLQQRLRNIDENLNNFYSFTPSEVDDHPGLSEDRLSSLLDDCARSMVPYVPHNDHIDDDDDSDSDGDAKTITDGDYTERNSVQESRQSLLDNPPRLSEDVLNALLEEARTEVNRRQSQLTHHSLTNAPTSPTHHQSPYFIGRDLDHSPNNTHNPNLANTDNHNLRTTNFRPDSNRANEILREIDAEDWESDDGQSPFLPEIPSRVSLVSHSNVQSFSARSRVSLQSVHSDDFE